MRLSDAIALGRTTVPKLLSGHLEGCAMGMAANAVGCRLYYDALNTVWPWLYGESFKCPECERTDNAMNVIVHLFDHHVMWDGTENFTLNQLIDWVRSVEPAEMPAPQIEQAVAIEEAHIEVCEKATRDIQV